MNPMNPANVDAFGISDHQENTPCSPQRRNHQEFRQLVAITEASDNI
jgi:hypothetical protein